MIRGTHTGLRPRANAGSADALGHKRTSRSVEATSALPPKADISQRDERLSYWGSQIRHIIGVRHIFDLGKIYERLGIVVFDIRVDTGRYPPWRITAPCVT